MAHRLKWLLGAGAALGAVTLLIRSADVNAWLGLRPAEMRQEFALAAEVRRADARLREAIYLDSLLPLLPSRPGVRVVLAPFVASDVAASIHDATAQQLAEVGVPRARAGVFVVPLTLGAHPRGNGGATAALPRHVYFAGADEGSPYCFVVAAARAGVDSLREAHGRDGVAEPLGLCFYWARYGAPGVRMQQWLRTSGYRFAELRRVAPHAGDKRPARRRLFGVRDYSGRSLFGDACLAGDRHACAHALMTPDDNVLTGRLPLDALAVYDRMMYRAAVFGRAERALLASVERAFGPDRFAQFWRSDDSVDVAFANAFGVPLGDWVHGWALRNYPEAGRVRAAVDPWTALLSLMCIAGLFAAGVVTARRRQIG